MADNGAAGTDLVHLPQGDFTASFRLLWIGALAIVIGALCAVVAYVLLGLIHLFTNLFYFHQFSFVNTIHIPANNALGLAAISVPIVGGLIIGFLARYGSDRIRG